MNQTIRNSEQLNALIIDRVPRDRLSYVFFDEIQNVDGWEASLAGLVAMGSCDVYVTGSNSDLLSSELATRISGRHVEIKVFPLSLREFMTLHGYEDGDEAFTDYLSYGGLPAVDPERGERYAKDYLQAVYSTVVINDVLRHVNASDPSKVESIIRFLYSNIGNLTNTATIAKELGMNDPTVSHYIEAMKEAFLILPCQRYDMVGKKLLKTNGKYYVTDLGMRGAVLGLTAGRDISKPLENLVYVELLRRGYDVRIGSYRDAEIDFIASRYDDIEYIQVCQRLSSEETVARETRPLLRPKDNYTKTILTLDRYGLGDEKGINVVNAVDWMLEE